jgi:RimJ/RimL family protein N-acetyltransferase
MTPELVIRTARVDDAESLVAYITRLVNEPHNNITRDPGQWNKTVAEEQAHIEKLICAPDNCLFLVAELGGEIVGIADIGRFSRQTERHVASIGLSVDAAHRRQGIGMALMRAILAWARTKELSRIELKVFTRNMAAIALYKKLGFVEEGLHRKVAFKQGVWVDDLTMALILE